MSTERKGLLKWIEYVTARGFISTLKALPVPVAYRLGRSIGWCGWKLMKKRKAIVRKNLEIVNAWASTLERSPLPDLDLHSQIREVFQRSGANLLSGFSMSGDPARIERHIEFSGAEDLREALDGNGAIVLIAHMGAWEALAHLPGMFQENGVTSPLASMYRPLNNVYMEHWYKAERERLGTQLIGSRHNFNVPADFLRSGGLLGILADQRASKGGRVRFFGRDVKATPLPGILQLRTKCNMLALSFETLCPGKWRIHFRKVDSGLSMQNKSRDATAQVCASVMEETLSRSLMDGFWFHNRFKNSQPFKEEA